MKWMGWSPQALGYRAATMEHYDEIIKLIKEELAAAAGDDDED